MNLNKPALADINDEIIKQWKTAHKKVFVFKSDDGQATGYFKSPDRRIMDAYSVKQRTNPVLCNELLVKDCFLGGDEKLITEDAYFYGLSQKLQALIDTKEGELTEL